MLWPWAADYDAWSYIVQFELHNRFFFLFLSSSPSSTYFARPADPLPDTEIDEHPRNSECDGQRDPDLPGLLQAIGQLVHVTSAGKE